MPDILNYLRGAWAVMNGRAEGFSHLDLSVRGFWLSFTALVPVILLLLVGDLGFEAEPAESEVPETPESLGVLIPAVDWFAFPLLFALIARQLGLSGRYVPFIVARNWGAVIIAAIYAVASLANLIPQLPYGVWAAIFFVCVGIDLRFSYLIATTTLSVGPAVAVPIVAIQVLLSLVIVFGSLALV